MSIAALISACHDHHQSLPVSLQSQSNTRLSSRTFMLASCKPHYMLRATLTLTQLKQQQCQDAKKDHKRFQNLFLYNSFPHSVRMGQAIKQPQTLLSIAT
eukprot:scaffold677705_cov64-Prasinocladus_malaysianus.AAC.1